MHNWQFCYFICVSIVLLQFGFGFVSLDPDPYSDARQYQDPSKTVTVPKHWLVKKNVHTELVHCTRCWQILTIAADKPFFSRHFAPGWSRVLYQKQYFLSVHIFIFSSNSLVEIRVGAKTFSAKFLNCVTLSLKYTHEKTKHFHPNSSRILL